MQFGLVLVVLLVGIDVLSKPPPIRLPVVAKELNIGLVLDVGLVYGVGCLEVQLQREPRGATILALGDNFCVGPPAGPLETGFQMETQGGVFSVDIGHLLLWSSLLKIVHVQRKMVLVDDGVARDQLVIQIRIFVSIITSLSCGN